MALGTPDNDQRGFRDPGYGLRLIVVCVLSIALMIADSRISLMQDIRRVLAASAYPLQLLIDAPAAFGRWLGDSTATRAQLFEENEQLRQTRLEQSARLQRMAALEAENARLRALLDSTAKVGDRVLIAEIMSVDMNPFRHRVVINKGSREGAFVGQALIDADGVVGQLTRDQVFAAEAILVTDIDHALPVEILRTRQRTIAVGTGQLDRLSLPFLPRNTDIETGDLLVTSGLGGTFPAGYPVAVVSEIAAESGAEFLRVDATPAAQLTRVREVLLIFPAADARPGADDLLAAGPDGATTAGPDGLPGAGANDPAAPADTDIAADAEPPGEAGGETGPGPTEESGAAATTGEQP
ncbi:MAG: rod shape-determining protein MreC [Chromatiales bacterium]|nr:MAG: rod shape-determining protein MreC [Chromatiales bacterium]